MPRIAVVGAGIIGLSQACVLQEQLPNAEITVIADKFSPHITSDIAAGFFHPYLLGDTPDETLNFWLAATFDYIVRLSRSNPTNGALLVSGYEFNKKALPRPKFADHFLNFRELPSDEVKAVRGQAAYPVEQGWFYTTVFLEPTTHLRYLMERFKARGGLVIQRHLKSLTDLGNQFDVIVNCSGLGARQLVGDHATFPTRGQVIRVRCPAVKHFYMDEETYCLPNSETTVLGGTAEKDDWDLTVRPSTAQWILEENAKKVPALKDAEIVSHHVGLRPSRPSVRLETEHLRIGGKTIPVVHNYGHGGSGVTLFYGCALDGAKLVRSELTSSKL